MKRILHYALGFFLVLGLAILSGCTTTTSTTTTAADTSTTTTTTETEISYYLAGNFNGYNAADPAYLLTEVEGEAGWYTITVTLTAEQRDPVYNDGHYYKVTEGNWTNCYGTSNYALQPAPVSPSQAGLGSIWLENDGTVTVLFDSATNTVYDSTMVREFANPIIYGDFNDEMDRGSDWSTASGSALDLTDEDEDGVFVGEYTLPAYEGTGDGYSMVLAVSEIYYIFTGYHAWGVNEQYKLDGTVAGMGAVTYLKPLTDTVYGFSYDSATHVTTVTEKVVQLANPVIYGDFCTWSLTDGSVALTPDDTDPTLYEGALTLAAGTYSFAVVLDKVNYGQWGWGAGTQYLLSGSSGGMGLMTYMVLAEETTLHFTYDSETHKTVVDHDAYETINPTLYGTFTRVSDDNECFLLKGEDAAIMTQVSGSTTLWEIDLVLPVFTAPSSGYYTADAGYRMLLVTTYFYYSTWNTWGAGTQYDLAGLATGTATIVNITTAGTYHFVYDSETHVTTYALK